MKKFIKEKYADIILQICTDYLNRHAGGEMSSAAGRALETLDKYSYYILGMGYMLHTEDIPQLKQCVLLAGKEDRFDSAVLNDVYSYL